MLMKFFLFFIQMLFFPLLTVAQVGIGTIDPDPSSILEIYSENKGILIPRMTTINRNLIENPSNGLLLYNTTTNAINYFDTHWRSLTPKYMSVNSTDEVSTTSTNEAEIPEMEISPLSGNHSVTFESQISNLSGAVNSETLLSDLNLLYTELEDFASTNTTHAATFGNSETITPGKYEVVSAISVSGTITLDGENTTDPVFIIKSSGAVNFAANTTVFLINGASAENVFWVGDGAVGVGADSVIHGNLISNGLAIAVGANCSVTGRMLTKSGAISFGPGVCSVPIDPSLVFDLGSLQSFVVYTGIGAVTNTEVSTYNGNICSGEGDTGSLAAATVNGIIMTPNTDTNVSGGLPPQSLIATFGIYQDDEVIPSSTKTITCLPGYTNISLSAIATTLEDDSITIKWKTDSGTLTVENRVLTAIQLH